MDMTDKQRLVQFKNGNYTVIFDTETGSKMRVTEDDKFIADFPESMDVKICNRCDLGCPQCHECSVPDGECGDILNAKFIETLHPYTELAIGGGNPLEHPDLDVFLAKCLNLKLIPNMTVNQTHFMRDYDRIYNLYQNGLIRGLGVSLNDPTDEFIELISTIPTAVVHTIVGMTATPKIFEKLANHNLKVLILGYKCHGRGVIHEAFNYDELLTGLRDLRDEIDNLLLNDKFQVISFDNLAVSQLKLEEHCSQENWETLYMGDDGEMTMYVDLVKGECARSSISTDRQPIKDNIAEMFKSIRK